MCPMALYSLFRFRQRFGFDAFGGDANVHEVTDHRGIGTQAERGAFDGGNCVKADGGRFQHRMYADLVQRSKKGYRSGDAVYGQVAGYLKMAGLADAIHAGACESDCWVLFHLEECHLELVIQHRHLAVDTSRRYRDRDRGLAGVFGIPDQHAFADVEIRARVREAEVIPRELNLGVCRVQCVAGGVCKSGRCQRAE